MKKVINVYTSQLYIQKDIPPSFKTVDITVKSGVRELAPDWSFLMEYKNSQKTAKDTISYVHSYYEKMRHTFTYFHDLLDDIITHNDVVLCCYCASGKFCHRQLLVWMLKDYAATRGVIINYAGEIVRGGSVQNHVGLDVPPFLYSTLGEIYAGRGDDVVERPDGDVGG